MKRLSSAIAVFLILSAAGSVMAADNLGFAAIRIEKGIMKVFRNMGSVLSVAAKETGRVGPDDEMAIRRVLRRTNDTGRPFAIDSTFIDSKGVMKYIDPDTYRNYEGSDISQQDAVIAMQKTKRPRLGELFISVEGIRAADIEYPVLAGNQFLGSISVLVKPEELIRGVAAPAEKELSVKCFVMQKDGTILYESDVKQIGHHTFTDPLFKDYPELVALGKKMVRQKEGSGYYSFTAPETKKVVKKKAVWRTVRLFGNDWIVVAYDEVR
ncbi:MAG: hypothetical protein PHY31_00955 [Smithellaceae bacterium]|nr:hypothetical protein [Smithellaceae bacterium]